jgi:hypothetical protein
MSQIRPAPSQLFKKLFKQGSHKKNKTRLIQRESGQVVLEYVLLLVIVASLGAFILRSAVSRNPDEPGFLVDKWQKVLETIAQDDPEE